MRFRGCMTEMQTQLLTKKCNCLSSLFKYMLALLSTFKSFSPFELRALFLRSRPLPQRCVWLAWEPGRHAGSRGRPDLRTHAPTSV